MKKIYTLLALLMFTLGSATAFADNGDAEGWNGKYISAWTTTAVTSLDDGQFYLMKNVGKSFYVQENSNTSKLTGTSLANTDGTALSTSYMSCVVKAVKIDNNGNWAFQFQSGGYMQTPTNVLSSWGDQISTGKDKISFAVALISSSSAFAIQCNSGSKLCLDGNDKPVGYGTTMTTKANENAAYQFFPVTLSQAVTATYTLNGNSYKYDLAPSIDSYPTFSSVEGFYTLTGTSLPSGQVTSSSTSGAYELSLTYDSNLPFSISSSATDATYYAIKTRSATKFLFSQPSTNSNIALATTYKTDIACLDAYTNVQNNRLWCITGDPIGGFEFHNKLGDRLIAVGSSVDDGQSAVMVESSESSGSTKWDIVLNSSSWFIKSHGSDNLYLSDYQGADPNTLRFWNSAANLTSNNGSGDDGSKMTFVSANDLTFEVANIPSAISTKSVSTYNLWVTDTSLTGESLYNAVAMPIKIEVGKYYNIVSTTYRNEGRVIYANPSNNNTDVWDTRGLYHAVKSSDNAVNALWTFETTDTDGLYKIRHANSQKLIAKISNAQADMPMADGNATTYSLTQYYKTPYIWQLKATESNGYYLNQKTDNTVVGYWINGDNGSQWYIQEVTTIPLTIYSDTQYASACYPFGVTLPETLQAYIATAANSNSASTETNKTGEVTLSSIGTSVPANTPVIIGLATNATAITSDTQYTLTINTSATATTDGNILTGATVARTGFDEGSIYVLTTDGSAAVMRPNTTPTSGTYISTIPANHAYLEKSKITFTNGDSSVNGLYFNFGETTGIHAVSTQTTDEGADTYYDLNGRRVLYPAHGIYVKGNGQKVFIK